MSKNTFNRPVTSTDKYFTNVRALVMGLQTLVAGKVTAETEFTAANVDLETPSFYLVLAANGVTLASNCVRDRDKKENQPRHSLTYLTVEN